MSLFTSLYLLSFSDSRAEEIYQYKVLQGEVLSKIVKRYFPSEKLYGSDGKIKQVIELNSHIKDKNLIFPNQLIKLSEFDPGKAEEEKVIDKTSETETKSEETSTIEKNSLPIKWTADASALYGIKYISYSQAGVLGNNSLDATLNNYFKLMTNFRREDWKLGFVFDTYKINYQNANSSINKSLSGFELNIAKNWISASLGSEQLPILRNSAGTLGLANPNIIYAGVGLSKEVEYTFIKPIFIELKSEGRYLFSSINQGSEAKSSSVNGYRLDMQAQLKMKILSKNEFQLFANWSNDLNYQKVTQTIKWDTATGKNKSTMTSASSAIGLLASF